jgi:hypothetical protein
MLRFAPDTSRRAGYTSLHCSNTRLFASYKVWTRLAETFDHPLPSSSEGKESSLQHFLHFLIIFLPSCFIICSPRTLLLFITSRPEASSAVSFRLVHAAFSPTLLFVIFFILP